MSQVREGHLTKTAEQRSEYFDNVIREGTTAPTLETVTHDTTDTAAPTEPYPTEYARNPRHGRLHGMRVWMRDHGWVLVLGVVLTAIVGLLGWFAASTYALNREVGVQEERIHAISDTAQRIEKQINQSDARLDGRFGVLEKRIERAEDRHDDLLRSMLPPQHRQ